MELLRHSNRRVTSGGDWMSKISRAAAAATSSSIVGTTGRRCPFRPRAVASQPIYTTAQSVSFPHKGYHSSSSPRSSPVCQRPGLNRGHACRIRCASTEYAVGTQQCHAPYSTQATRSQEPIIHDMFEHNTGTWQYVVADPSTLTAVIIDPVLDYDPATQSITTSSADSILSLVREKGYKVDRILETHVHADHITAASYLQSRLSQEQGHRPPIGIGKRIEQVQRLFGERYGVPAEDYQRVFGKLFDDNEVFAIGEISAMAMHLPGHTPDHLGYKIGDNVFCGDSLFHVDIGSARCDFPGGSADNLYESGRKLLGLPATVKIWTGHDYPPEERGSPVPFLSVKDHREQNQHLRVGITKQDFVARRKERDSKLAAPRLLHQSLQMNIRAGQLPRATQSGHRMLHLPLKLHGIEW
ncbi:metallo-beta-lactamase domain protein [Aspergillus rambellii]|uniref:Metallo-beta-lactamase domain protein n=1 Tax=Aspergillus rambellii TaxID=308745 RepID=A0A0F8XSX5_9EURO|nr:metallo-beta-lactamase domain protein [Aspergillus rambellii]